MIDLAIYNDHQLVLEAMTKLISQISEFRVLLSARNMDELLQNLRARKVHILIHILSDDSQKNLNLVNQLKIAFPRMPILIISQNDGEEIIMKAVKSGAKGFLGRDSNANDLKEAILTLRNGYEYFGNSITRIV